MCGHDRAVGGEVISVRLLHTVTTSKVVIVPTSKFIFLFFKIFFFLIFFFSDFLACGTTSEIGTCHKTILNPGSHPPNQQVGGLHDIRFLTDMSGFYDVELTAGGTTSVIGRVYVAE